MPSLFPGAEFCNNGMSRTTAVTVLVQVGAYMLRIQVIRGLFDVECWGIEEGDDGGPPRQWVPNGMYPGTAFTRSIDDSVADSIGVVASCYTSSFVIVVYVNGKTDTTASESASPAAFLRPLVPQVVEFFREWENLGSSISFPPEDMGRRSTHSPSIARSLFSRKLTDSWYHVSLDCIQRVEVQTGDVVVKQDSEGGSAIEVDNLTSEPQCKISKVYNSQ
ncbi:hypothetical protein FEM48_Zijuj05G0111800 [Ziziphus jujuba var. spinosa]|uniref:Uncharacterized protein n=1 Tax=Ziziphus jujuba var. spinosa TaxID=714518 RepID=A0A978VEM1_ZIZJJ|nr:hypothetical protein FEM48_Zijuj05G0111800 [Ziziphus jujuba var. spinosa]